MDHKDYVDLLKPAGLSPGGVWADLGAGAGSFTLALRELVGPEAAIYAVDRDEGSLKELQRDWLMRYGDIAGLHLHPGDFAGTLDLPLLDGVLMANSLHFYRNPEVRRRINTSAFRPPDKVVILRHIGSFLKPGGRLLLVEYDADSGNIWVPYPLRFETFCQLASQAGFGEPMLLASHPSRFLGGFYAAEVLRN